MGAHQVTAIAPILAILYALGFTNLFLRSSFGVMAPELAREMALEPAMLSTVASAYFFAYVILQPLAGALGDRLGLKRVLVAMTLAGIALFRQVGPGVVIAGNLAFKENASSVADMGIETARAWLTGNLPFVTPPPNLINDQPAAGYYSSWQPLFDPLNTPAIWADGTSYLATADDGTGNEVRYIVHRLCSGAGLSVDNPAQSCVTFGAAGTGGSKGGGGYGMAAIPNTMQPYFRITVRSAGPRNTVSYVQGIMY